MQKGVGDGSTYSHETKSIIERTSHLDTKLHKPEKEVLAAFAGMRPSRTGGARIERDSITVKGQKKPLVHNYGAGGTGYQAGYGMALDAVQAAEDELKGLAVDATKAKL